MVSANSNSRASQPPATEIPMNSENPEQRAQSKVPWSTSLYGCFSDCDSCCLTLWCPCITFGRISEIVDRGSITCCQNGTKFVLITCMTSVPCLYSCSYRSKMRQQYSLQGSLLCDFFAHCFCQCCALCQEYRELKNHGFDMTIRWHGNMEQNRGIATPPVVQGGMTR